VALIVWIPLIATNWPLIYQHWYDVAENKAGEGQNYQEIQTVILAVSAFTSFVTFGAILFQASIAQDQAIISKQQTDIQRAQHIATHRPRINVKGVRFVHRMETDIDAGTYTPTLCAEYVVVNVGASTAKIISGVCVGREVSFIHENRFLDLRNGAHLKGEIIGPGQIVTKTRIICSLDMTPKPMGETARKSIQLGCRVRLQGGFVYSDETGATYRMGFCRTYDPNTQRWTASEDVDLEYSD